VFLNVNAIRQAVTSRSPDVPLSAAPCVAALQLPPDAPLRDVDSLQGSKARSHAHFFGTSAISFGDQLYLYTCR